LRNSALNAAGQRTVVLRFDAVARVALIFSGQETAVNNIVNNIVSNNLNLVVQSCHYFVRFHRPLAGIPLEPRVEGKCNDFVSK
jgi:hypothetical protein